MTRKDIIAVRRKLRVPGQFQGQWATLVDVGFDGDWVSPIQKTSNSTTGPVLVAKHWLDAESANRHRATLEPCGYLPEIPFNRALDRVLEAVGVTRKDIYITQACHFLPTTDRRKPVPAALMKLSIEAVTRHEVKGRRAIALGGEAVSFSSVSSTSTKSHSTSRQGVGLLEVRISDTDRDMARREGRAT